VGAGRIAAVAVLLAGCASAPVRDDVHDEPWLLVETDHIALRTDLDRDDAIDRAREVERLWQALASHYALVAPGAAPPPGRFQVVHLDSCHDFNRIRTNADGFVLTARGFPPERIAVTCERREDGILIHELAHIFNHHFFASGPIWLNEGLATYYSTMTVLDGKVVLGNFSRGLYTMWHRRGWMPRLDEIRRMNAEDFYGDGRGRNYFAAWKLVHMLNNTSNERQRQFRRYLAGIASGAGNDQAWRTAFGEASLADEYRDYQFRQRLNVRTAPYTWPEIGAPRLRRLRAGEAHLVWAHLLAVEHDAKAVADQLDRAIDADPDWIDLLYWRAVLPRLPDAIRLLRSYVARKPADPRGWHGLVSIQLRQLVPPSYLGLAGKPPAGLAAMQDDVRRLIEQTSHPDALNLVGWYYALRQMPNAGLNFAIRAVRADPGCGGCWDTLGLLYYQAGKLPEAVAAQERAANLYAEDVPEEVLVRLRRYRAAATRRGGRGE
jgi:tetratricopeptide (TPR) repeat protein